MYQLSFNVIFYKKYVFAPKNKLTKLRYKLLMTITYTNNLIQYKKSVEYDLIHYKHHKIIKNSVLLKYKS